MTKILPEEFIQQTQKLMGEEMFAQLSDAICHSEPPTSIRLNRFKAPQGTHLADNNSTDAEAEVKTHHESEKTAASVVPWCPDYGIKFSINK